MRATVELGDAVGLCTGCGWARRYLLPDSSGVPATCPDCGGPVLLACPACDEPVRSIAALTCSACHHELRGPELFGRPIRRKPERHAARAPQCAGEVAAAFAEADG